MALRFLVTGLVAAAIGTAVGLLIWPDIRIALFGPQQPRVVTTGVALVGGPFRLQDQKGRTVTSQDFLGRNLIVFFGYASATDTTPAALQLITDVLERLGKRAKDFQPLFITIDPDRDTPERLAAFARRYHPDLLALTGDRTDLSAVANAYRVKVRRRQFGSTAGSDFDHTSYIYVMGRDGKYAGHFPYTIASRDLVARLRSWP